MLLRFVSSRQSLHGLVQGLLLRLVLPKGRAILFEQVLPDLADELAAFDCEGVYQLMMGGN
ncbi:hypothetical protein NLM15_37790 [Bradyrhizobium sp. CCGB20]|nr:hypothetical protein [Bradyrhizobium sp. CCGB20]MCP3402877.1 hypothetical protein [Bradyrhizobium sp. CCGB20]